MEDLKNKEKTKSIDTAKLIEISREVLRVSRQLREKKKEPAKPKTFYEKLVEINPYLSKNSIISYY